MTENEEKYLEYTRIPENQPLRRKIFIIVFGTDSPKGKLFDVCLLILIIISVVAVMLESVPSIKAEHKLALRNVEIVMTVLFTIEYLIRIWIVEKPKQYIFSFLGIIDFLAIIPSYLSFFLVGTQGFAIIRALRILRVFRILKLMRFVKEAHVLGKALKASRHKITVFFLFLLVLVFILGSIMYLVEGGDSGFQSIPRSIYWAIVTLTTVGYGDITPSSVPGQFIASIVMLLGYAIIAIPTGIISTEVYKAANASNGEFDKHCTRCGHVEGDEDAKFCKHCGKNISEAPLQ